MSDWQGFSPLNDFTGPLLDNLKRHPKRIVFPEGEDVRVLRVSERFVNEQAGVPILLGRKEIIRRMAEMNGISLKFVRIIEPEKALIFKCSVTVMNGRNRCSGTACP